MRDRFSEMRTQLHVVTNELSESIIQDTQAVPMISYGAIGTNMFEHFDVALCLTGYYVTEQIVSSCLQDLTRGDLRIPIKITIAGDPKRRRASVVNPDHRFCDLAPLTQPTLEFKEGGVVLQAVGRVRPFSRPREIWTFQMGCLPGVKFDHEFRSLAEARKFLSIPTRREREQMVLASRISDLRRQGHSQAQTAELVGKTVKTIRNYERKENRKSTMS